MTTFQHGDHLTWVHLGDLHITNESEPNYRDFLALIDTLNIRLAGHVDFCVLPGDNADDGTADQYASIRRGLQRLEIPLHVIPGDHDRKPGDLRAFYQGLGLKPLPYAVTAGGCRCLFLDVVSPGTGGPDFAVGRRQLAWLESELEAAALRRQPRVVFMHAYPADLGADGEAVRRLLRHFAVTLVDMGHTHYNELANDGTTIFAATRSTGQIEEGPVGFSLVSVNDGVVSWRFKPLRSPWPFVMITAPVDHRLLTDVTRPDHLAADEFTVIARAWSVAAPAVARCRIDTQRWVAMQPGGCGTRWELRLTAPSQQFSVTVEITDAAGGTAVDTVVVATPGYRPPQRIADGSDADALAAWPDRHLLGTRLGPNRNGRPW